MDDAVAAWSVRGLGSPSASRPGEATSEESPRRPCVAALNSGYSAQIAVDD